MADENNEQEFIPSEVQKKACEFAGLDWRKYKDNDSIVADLLDKLSQLKSVHFQMNNFYNEYNESIKWLCARCEFKVTFNNYYCNEDGVVCHKKVESKSLDELKKYIESRISNNSKNYDDEVIICPRTRGV